MFAGAEDNATFLRGTRELTRDQAALRDAASGRGQGSTGIKAIVMALVTAADEMDLETTRQVRHDLRRLRQLHEELALMVLIDGADAHLRRSQRRLEAAEMKLAHEHRHKSLVASVRHLLSVKPMTPEGIARELKVTEVDAHRAIAELRDSNEIILRPVTDSDAPDLDGYWVLDLRTPGRGSVLEAKLAEYPDIVEVWIRTAKWWVALPAGEAIARLRAQ